jgi:hypothetical protein
MLVEIGENPSFNFQEEYKNGLGDQSSDVKEELRELHAEISEAKIRRTAEIEKAEEARLEAAGQVLAASIELLNFDDEPTPTNVPA